MAKFKITPALITPLTEAGFIDESGNIPVVFVWRNQGEIQRYYKVTLSAASDIVETSNEAMVASLEVMPPAAVKVNGEWIIGNPGTTKLFEAVPDEDPNPTIDPAVSGVRQISSKDKNLVVRYANMSKNKPEPAGQDYVTLQPWVEKARTYFKARKL